MPISFGGKPRDEDVVSLIAARRYTRAIELLKAQIRDKGANPSLRMQLADVLVLADKKSEAIGLLLPLADQYAIEGFAAKAVSVLKKVQKLDPGRRDVDSRLARLIQEKQREAPEAEPADDGPALEIGFDMGPISTPAAASSSLPDVSGWSPNETLPFDPTRNAVSVGLVAEEPSPLEPRAAAAPADVPLVEAEPLPSLDPETPPAAPPTGLPALELDPAAVEVEPALVEVEPVQDVEVEPVPDGKAPAAKQPEGIEDYDLLYAGEAADQAEAAVEGEEPMSAEQFAGELMSLVDTVFQATPAASAAAETAHRSGTQIVVSPLFRDFSVDEMVAVIEGLKLLTFERGNVILREGQSGASLYMLTSGRVRVFRKDPATGKQNTLGDLAEGAFFGEVSILTGRPRMASIVALTRCELLQLDRATLDSITKTHPRVWDVLREFAARREAASASRRA